MSNYFDNINKQNNDKCNNLRGHSHNHSDNCNCGKDHNNINLNELKITLLRIIAGAVFFVLGLIFKFFPIYVVAYLILGADVLINGIKYIFTKKILSEYLLMSIASIVAFVLGEPQEAVAIMLFYQIGELFCENADYKTKKSIKELVDIKPEYANRLNGDKVGKVSPEELKIDDIIIVSTGEKIPVDAIVTEGKTQLDTSKMTGEEEYRYVVEGNEVISGCINCGKLIKLRVLREYKNSSVSKVSALLDEIEQNKSKSEKFITVFAKYYTPVVVLLAIITAVIPPLLLNQELTEWIHRSLLFLVVSCPCALIISVPIAFFTATGAASKKGVLIKGSMAIERLAKTKTVAFDKTGTLTNGAFKLIAIRCNGLKQEILEYFAYAEFYSTHPLSGVMCDEYKKIFKTDINPSRISDYTEIAGMGIRVIIDGNVVLVGNEKILVDNNIEYKKAKSDFTVSYIAINNKCMGYAEYSDGVKNDSKSAVNELITMGITPLLLSGDKKETVDEIAKILNIDKSYSGLLPQDKVEIVKGLQEGGNVAFVGDGINDAPVISMSNVGISMGLEGSAAAVEASQVVVLSDDVSKIPLGIKISKKAMSIVYENIIFAIGIKVLIMILGFFGIANLWIAVFGDVGVSVLCILNALRGFFPND